MLLGDKLSNLRKKSGLSQEEVANNLFVSRQTISKWETGQTVPELSKAKMLSKLYNVSYNYLINDNECSKDMSDIEQISDVIDWTKAWSTKYPILDSYQTIKEIDKYKEKISQIYDEFKLEFEFDETDILLILKDILYQKYKKIKKD